MLPIRRIIDAPGPRRLTSVPVGLQPWLLADLARATHRNGQRTVLIARDEAAGRAIVDTVGFFAPDVQPIWLPAWDCLPYDRASPAQNVLADRLAALAQLLQSPESPEILVTTVSAAMQRLLQPDVLASATRTIRQGETLGQDALLETLARAGYTRVENVADAGDYAVRGGLVDVVPPLLTTGEGGQTGYRIDFFGDEVDAIRVIDPMTQLTTGRVSELQLLPVSELLLDDDRIRRFRRRWLELFGADATKDPVYQAASEGRRVPELLHYLPLFEEGLSTLVDWLADDALLLLEDGVPAAAEARRESIVDYHASRVQALAEPPASRKQTGRIKGSKGSSSALSLHTTPSRYRPLDTGALYLSAEEWQSLLAPAHQISFFDGGPEEAVDEIAVGGLPAVDFAPLRVAAAAGGPGIYQALATALAEAGKTARHPILAAYSEGSRARLIDLLDEKGVRNLKPAESWQQAQGLAAKGEVPVVVLPLESGFRLGALELWSEQDMLGDRLVRKRSKQRADAFLKDLQTLEPGELVVHQDHGIGRYLGLMSIEVSGAPHDTVALEYAGNDKLYVPVENLDVLSRYGSDNEGVALDRLGGTGWQKRKAELKQRIREIAHDLLRTAALRATREAERFEKDAEDYAAFLSGFPWIETDDQLRATEDVLNDLQSGRPMDRLICGDVGFGKTEVALRASYVAAMAGQQVAIVCPTTLLARQHAETFRSRFAGTGLNVGVLSRLVPAPEARRTRDGLADGTVDIVIGTHALLSKNVEFARLGLVVVDEEQHFGVTAKERLKALRADVHVLTLTATPIPRTLQMALSGIRELSVIATPPVDRLAVRTSVAPFDPLIVRETLLREHYRGGQSFVVVPRISMIPELEQYLREAVPEVRPVVAHGQMAASEIEDRMLAFTDGQYDVLLSTSIIESGIDIPNANTLIVYRADMFGLSGLYQLRGRVGRAKRRAYALLTTAADGQMTAGAEKRLQVLSGLDSLGAGFELASHDLDQRGAGNLLGDEQSGHIREVGFELYQSMLEDAIMVAKAAEKGLRPPEDPGSPTIAVDAAVMIPEDYVPDLSLRMALYRRVADLKSRDSIEAFAAELIDRFGQLPEPTANLLKIVEARNAARLAHIAKIEVGPKGALVTFADSGFPNPLGLVQWMERLKGQAKLRPDQKLFLSRDLGSPGRRLSAAVSLARGLGQVATREPASDKDKAAEEQPAARPAPGAFKAKSGRRRR